MIANLNLNLANPLEKQLHPEEGELIYRIPNTWLLFLVWQQFKKLKQKPEKSYFLFRCFFLAGGSSSSPTYHSINPSKADFIFVPLSVASALKRSRRDSGISKRYSTSLSCGSGTALTQIGSHYYLLVEPNDPNKVDEVRNLLAPHVNEVYHVKNMRFIMLFT